MERIIKKIEEPYLKTSLPILEPGDMVKVVTKVIEGDKSRLQTFEGVVISIQGEGMGKSVKVRKISYGIGVERTFPLNSPNVDSFEIVKKGAPRRAKLFYLRDRVGKRALKVKAGKKKVEYEELLSVPVEALSSDLEVESKVGAEVSENKTEGETDTTAPVDAKRNTDSPQVKVTETSESSEDQNLAKE